MNNKLDISEELWQKSFKLMQKKCIAERTPYRYLKVLTSIKLLAKVGRRSI